MGSYKPNISVCLLLMNNEEEVVLLRRFNTGYQDGKYEFPSGHIEEGEALTVAVVREAFEEICVTVEVSNLEFVGCVDNHVSGKHVNFLFKTNKFIGIPKIMEIEECDDLCWRKITDLLPSMEDLSVDTKRFVDMMISNSVFKAYTGEEIFNK